MAEYNELTKQLLAAGYTAENFPKDKVHIAMGIIPIMEIRLITYTADLNITASTVKLLLIRPGAECS